MNRPAASPCRELTWRGGHDWRTCETLLNGCSPHRTTIDGLGIHFLHIHSPEPDALPLAAGRRAEFSALRQARPFR